MKSNNKEILENFAEYCKAFPEQRFWQALCNWSGAVSIYFDDKDTYYWPGKNEFETKLISKKNEQFRRTVKNDRNRQKSKK